MFSEEVRRLSVGVGKVSAVVGRSSGKVRKVPVAQQKREPSEVCNPTPEGFEELRVREIAVAGWLVLLEKRASVD